MYTHDSGATWHMPQYQRWLAPWVYVAWLLLVLATFLVLRIERNIRREKLVADLLVSDEPVALPEDDRLGHRELVAALSAFLRNRRTVPPLSVAITARWGKGKSSVMRLLERSLRQHGTCTVWFNAWHYQKEEIVLAALLENIRAQALPFWLSPWGLIFRLHMLFLRAVRHFAVATLVGVVLWFGVAVLFAHGDKLPDAWRAISWQPLLQLEWKEFVAKLYQTVAAHPQLIHVVAGLVAVIGALVFVLLYGLRAFPEHPAVLLATLSEKFKTRHAEAQTAFRYKFARHFGDVCTALRPRTLTLFIDDLDRCTPEKALETLEAVNYLVSSGACYVVLGMDKKVVESLVGLASEKLAREMMVEEKVPNGDNGASTTTGENTKPADPLNEEVERRRAYARQYLEKLVNFELPVPATEAGGYLGMTKPRRDSKLAKSYEVNATTWRFFGPYLIAVTLGFFAAVYFINWKPAAEGEKPQVTATSPAPLLPEKAAPATPKQTAMPAEEKWSHTWGSGFVPADPLNDYDYLAWLLAFTALFSVFFWHSTRSRHVLDDSLEFRKALKIWLPLAVARRDSPRQAKRFINHARFLAMRARGAESGQGLREKLMVIEAVVPGIWRSLKRLRNRRLREVWCWFKRRKACLEKLRRANQAAISAEKLVALAAISYAFPEAISYDGLEEFDFKMGYENPDDSEVSVADAHYTTALRNHEAAFPAQWPPSPDELEIFRNWANSLRQN